MSMIRPLLARISAFFRKQTLDQELEAELDAHLELSIEDNIKQGMSVGEARRNALTSLGRIEAAKELHRATRSAIGSRPGSARRII